MSMRPADTSTEAWEVYLAAQRALSPQEKFSLTVEMSETAWRLAAVGIGMRHPEYSPSQVDWALKRMLWGTELFTDVLPDAPLVDP